MGSATSSFPGLPTFGFSLQLVATGLFGIAFLAVLVVSLMLFYHWIRYGVGVAGTFIAMVSYTIGITVLLLSLLGLLTQI